MSKRKRKRQPKRRRKVSRAHALGQYDTPDALAARQVAMIELAPLRIGARVLEPGAGVGRLVRALRAARPDVFIDAVEIDEARAMELRERTSDARIYPPHIAGSVFVGNRTRVFVADYLALPPPRARYDLCIANPNFTGGAECALLAKMLDESERAIVQIPVRSMHGRERFESIWSQVGRAWWIRAELRIAHRVYKNASDDLVILDMRREPGPCALGWWGRVRLQADSKCG